MQFTEEQLKIIESLIIKEITRVNTLIIGKKSESQLKLEKLLEFICSRK